MPVRRPLEIRINSGFIVAILDLKNLNVHMWVVEVS